MPSSHTPRAARERQLKAPPVPAAHRLSDPPVAVSSSHTPHAAQSAWTPPHPASLCLQRNAPAEERAGRQRGITSRSSSLSVFHSDHLQSPTCSLPLASLSPRRAMGPIAATRFPSPRSSAPSLRSVSTIPRLTLDELVVTSPARDSQHPLASFVGDSSGLGPHLLYHLCAMHFRDSKASRASHSAEYIGSEGSSPETSPSVWHVLPLLRFWSFLPLGPAIRLRPILKHGLLKHLPNSL